MKKLIAFTMPIKIFASMIFAGLMCLYIASGVLYGFFIDADFSYSIPFVFVIQGLLLSVLIAVFWEVFFGDIVIKKLRFIWRIIAFGILLMALLAVCFLTFFAIPTEWAYMWLVAVGAITLFVAIMSGLNELYYRKTGEKYTEMLRIYKERQQEINPPAPTGN